MATPSSSRKTPKSTARSHERPSSLDRRRTRAFLDGVFGDDLHAERVLSLANGVSGVLRAATLSIHAIGQAYAKLGSIGAMHGVKQVDRLLSNDASRVEDLTPLWASFVLGPREEVVIALDWTEFDDDDHITLCAYIVTRHGRATPLAWKTVAKSTLSEQRSECEVHRRGDLPRPEGPARHAHPRCRPS